MPRLVLVWVFLDPNNMSAPSDQEKSHDSVCVQIQGLRPSKDSAYPVNIRPLSAANTRRKWAAMKLDGLAFNFIPILVYVLSPNNRDVAKQKQWKLKLVKYWYY